MKNWLWRPLLAAVLCLGAGRSYRLAVVPEEVPAPRTYPREEPFADISFGQRWYDGAQYGYRRGVILGVSETEFGGELPATRAMAATMLWRMAGRPEVLGPGGFSDVGPGEYYTAAVVWGERRGLWKGCGDNTFRPHEPVTRDQLALVLERYLGEEQSVGAAALRRPPSPGPGRGEEPGGELTRGELAETLMERWEGREKEAGRFRGSETPAPGRSGQDFGSR